jgi:hypothetical protein
MRRLFMLLAVLLPFAAQAADEANVREAHAVFEAMHMSRQLDAMSGPLGKAMAQQFGATGNPRVGELLMQESLAVMKERMLAPGGLMDAAVAAYADTYTIDELRDIRHFYESPTGQKMLGQTPQLMSWIMEASMKTARASIPEVCNRTRVRLQGEGLAEEAAKMKCAAAAPAKGTR